LGGRRVRYAGAAKSGLSPFYGGAPHECSERLLHVEKRIKSVLTVVVGHIAYDAMGD